MTIQFYIQLMFYTACFASITVVAVFIVQRLFPNLSLLNNTIIDRIKIFAVVAIYLNFLDFFVASAVLGLTGCFGNILTGNVRLTYLLIAIPLFVSILAVIPLYVKRSFADPVFFRHYKRFWLITSLILSYLYLMLLNISPEGMIRLAPPKYGIAPNSFSLYEISSGGYVFNEEYIVWFLCVDILILLLTLAPAFYQWGRLKIRQ